MAPSGTEIHGDTSYSDSLICQKVVHSPRKLAALRCGQFVHAECLVNYWTTAIGKYGAGFPECAVPSCRVLASYRHLQSVLPERTVRRLRLRPSDRPIFCVRPGCLAQLPVLQNLVRSQNTSNLRISCPSVALTSVYIAVPRHALVIHASES